MFGKRRKRGHTGDVTPDALAFLDAPPAPRPPTLYEDSPLWDQPGPRTLGEVNTSMGYIDMGSVLLPSVKGMQLRTEMAADGKSVVRVLVVLGDSGLQISAAAAPRSGGVWDEVRAQIAQGLLADGGTVTEVDSRYGVELHADVPVTLPDGRAGSSRMRIIGREGPRWFSRIDILGPAAVNESLGRELERVIDRIVIARDSHPRARLELLPIHVPDALVEGSDVVA